MQQVSTTDVHFLVREWQEFVGAKIVKIHQPSHKEIVFQLHVVERGTQYLTIILPNGMFVCEEKIASANTPPMFCTVLRKILTNSRIQGIKQIGSERVVEIEMSTKEGSFFVIVELFSKGNLILCDSNLTIKIPLESQTWQSRSLKRGEKYSPPPQGMDVLHCTARAFEHTVSRSEKNSISAALATDLQLGGVYAKELCLRAGVSPLGKDGHLFEALKALLAEKEAHIYEKEEKIATPIRFQSLHQWKETKKDSFNQALSEVMLSQREILSPAEEKIKKQKDILDSQLDNLGRFAKEMVECQKTGEIIYEKYAELQEIFELAKKKPEGWKSDISKHKLVKQFLEKKGEVVVEI